MLCNWKVVLSLLFHSVLINCIPTYHSPNDLNYNYQPQLTTILDYLNSYGDHNYNYKFGYILSAHKETDDISSIELEVQADCFDTNVCVTRILQCNALVEYFSSINKYEILPDINCTPAEEDTSSTPNDFATTDTYYENNDEIKTEPEVVKKVYCLNCAQEINKNVEGIDVLLDTALKHIESERDRKHVVIHVLRAERQIVAGIKYVLWLEIAPTTCSVEADVVLSSAPCLVDPISKSKICEVKYLEQPWISKSKNIIYNNCTMSQAFPAVNLNPSNELNNEIDVNNDYQKPVDDHFYGENRPNFQKMAENGNFDDSFIDPVRLAAIESEIIPTDATDSKIKEPMIIESTKSGIDNSQLGVEDIPSVPSSTDTIYNVQDEQAPSESQIDDSESTTKEQRRKRDANSSSNSEEHPEEKTHNIREKRDVSSASSSEEQPKTLHDEFFERVKRETKTSSKCNNKVDSSSSSSSSSDDKDDNNNNCKNDDDDDNNIKKTDHKSNKIKKEDKKDDSSSSSSSSDDNNKRNKRDVKPDDKTFIYKLADYAASSFDDSKNKHQVIDVLKVHKIELEGAVYLLKLRLNVVHCSEVESCENVGEKLCKVQVHVGKHKHKKILQSHCHNFEKITHDRSKRQIPGAPFEFKDDDQVLSLTKSTLLQLDAKSSHETKYKVIKIIDAKKQVVSGLLYKIKAEIQLSDCPKSSKLESAECGTKSDVPSKICDIRIWDQPWLTPGRETNVTCDSEHHVFRTRRYISNELDNGLSHNSSLFKQFMKDHNKLYNNNEELAYRYEVFQENLKLINLLNKHEQGTGKYAINKFADLTKEEFTQFYLGYRPDLRVENDIGLMTAQIPDINLPTEFDWRTKGAVTEVKNQGQCGSCWAFSVTGNIEGQNAIKHGQLLEFSEQELVDCDKSDDGCGGGLMDNAYRAIEQIGGLEGETDYPYDAENEACHFDQSKVEVQVSGAVNISQDETDMAKWLVGNGPISIGLNANAMQFYVGGVSHPPKILCNPKDLDHGVLIVGYGTTKSLFHKSLPYWIVKNSWSTHWGEKGYYRVFRGDGTCGLNTMASSAIIV